MTIFQLLLFILAGGILYLFFKQLFSGNHPKRGIDFEAKVAEEQIGGINRPNKIFSRPAIQMSRIEELLDMADKAVERKDYEEAHKALGSALIVDENNLEALGKMGYVSIVRKDYEEAKASYEKILSLDENDDMAHSSLANVLHSMNENEKAKIHHKKAIELDKAYAPHHFNYANTLYDLGENSQALEAYKQAYALDNSLEEAKKMIESLGAENES